MATPADGVAADLSSWQTEAFGPLEVVDRTCPLCGDDNASTPPTRYSLGRWIVKTCRTCTMTYITSAPRYEVLSEQMSWEKSSQLESEWRDTTRTMQQTVSRATRWRLRLLPRRDVTDLVARYGAPGKILDLGCGDGRSCETLAPGYVPYGIEVSREGAEVARARFAAKGGGIVNASGLDGARSYPANFATVAILQSYLEHEARPVEVLREVHRVLTSDGLAIVKVPNYGSLNRRVMGPRWCGFRYPDHLNYFTPGTLRRMGEAAGFSVWFGPTWRLPTSDSMWALLRKRPDDGASRTREQATRAGVS